MKPRVFAALLVLLPVFAFYDIQQAPVRGTWTVDHACKNFVDLQTNFRSGRGLHGNTMKISRNDIKPGATQGTVQFTVTRSAGTFSFTGTLVEDMGSGQVQFTANPQFPKDMAALGYTEISDSDLLRMALNDFGPQFVRDLQQVGYTKLPLESVIRMKIHEADAEFVRALAQVGFKNRDPEELIRMRIHDATPDFIQQMRTAGYANLTAEDFIRMRIHDVTPEFAQEMSSWDIGTLRRRIWCGSRSTM
jgi:hypothetical protein